MNRNFFTTIVIFLLIAFPIHISTTGFAMPDEIHLIQQSSLPTITYLGQGPQTFTVQPPLKFLVKSYQNGQFLFVTKDGLTYKAAANERVWTIDVVPDENIRLFDESKSYGIVEAGCVVNYVQIEDNVDSRRNTFYINGKTLQVVEQGMVTYGSFTVPEAGELTFFAEDSIGMILELCKSLQTALPSVSPTTTTIVPSQTVTEVIFSPTETTTATEAISTPTVSALNTLTPTSTMQTANLTQTLTAFETSTATQINTDPPPQNTPTPVTSTSVASTPLATAQIVQITATPMGTVNAFPVTGGGPGPREIKAISLTILGLFVLVGAAWWFLIHVFIQKR